MNLFRNFARKFDKVPKSYDATAAYDRHLDSKLAMHKGNTDLAFADAIGSVSIELFHSQGDGHVTVLRHQGLADGMAVYDLGCGCGRTAQAMQRSGWTGSYTGADIIPRFVDELKAKCPGYTGIVNQRPTIVAPDTSLDMIFHWSVFTHLPPEECFLYMKDSWRALKPNGKLVFSFLELNDPNHLPVFDNRVQRTAKKLDLNLLDTFLHRDWIRIWAQRIGFREPEFTDGDDSRNHPPFWQSLVAMQKQA